MGRTWRERVEEGKNEHEGDENRIVTRCLVVSVAWSIVVVVGERDPQNSRQLIETLRRS